MVDKIWYNMEELIDGSEERVLIETYWNVKSDHGITAFPLSRINRNILECKVKLFTEGVVQNTVLIETYWNVKRLSICFPGQLVKCINRNILECKDITAGIHKNMTELY